jgi:hypothetical protein
MSLKGWVLNKVNRLVTRVDLPPRATPLGQAIMRRAGEPRAPGVRANGNQDTLPRPQHLGAYAPLVAAMREELEQFVTSHVRMHLAIAEHDRYLLTSIEIECVAGDESRELLQRFMREFKPEQIKLYLAKEVIGRLPNASAIDLALSADSMPHLATGPTRRMANCWRSCAEPSRAPVKNRIR